MSEFISRRDFLKVAGLGVAAVAGVQMTNQQAEASEAAVGEHQWVMVIDQGKCAGCGYCVNACKAHNDIHPEITWNPIFETGKVLGQQVYLPRPCMQCAKAPCVDVCMVKASYYRDDGIVMMDYDRCIGCRYCQIACPYEARSFNWKDYTQENPYVPEWGQPEVERRPRGVPEKCAFCYQRIDRGLSLGLKPGVDTDATPACVGACPTGARLFGDLNDPHSEVSQIIHSRVTFRLREDLGTGPRVYYLPVDINEGS
jgi:Fe-S-cluster-containing dehydrogenase component